MPAVTHNSIKVVGDIGFLFITAASLKQDYTKTDVDVARYGFDIHSTVKIIFDAKFEPHMFGHKWYWDRIQRRCFTYFAGNKIYLTRMIARWSLGHDNFERVIMLDGVCDYRRANLHIKLTPNYREQLNETPTITEDTLSQEKLAEVKDRLQEE